MKRRIWIAGGGLILACMLVVTALYWRNLQLQVSIDRLRSFFEKQGATFQVEGAGWVGWNTARFDSLTIQKADDYSLIASGLEISVNPLADSWLGKASHLSWKSLSLKAKNQDFFLHGEVWPSALKANLVFSSGPVVGSRMGWLSSGRHESGSWEYSASFDQWDCSADFLADTIVGLPSVHASGQIVVEGGKVSWRQTAGVGSGLDVHAEANWEPFSGGKDYAYHFGTASMAEWVSALPRGKEEQGRRLDGLKGVDAELSVDWHRASGNDIPLISIRASRCDSNSFRSIFDTVPRFDHRRLPKAVLRSILLAEDAGFWEHDGVDAGIMEAALWHNLASGRAVRGGGTITMQLVRNALGLGHRKDLTRKAEELLWAVAIEQGGLSKAEILDCYLGVIEWGPDVYGMNDAADYYFHCSPERLSLDQGIFLASIIPNPKQFSSQLFPDGSLRPFAVAFHESIRWLLVEEGVVDEEILDEPMPVFPGIGKRGVHEIEKDAIADVLFRE